MARLFSLPLLHLFLLALGNFSRWSKLPWEQLALNNWGTVGHMKIMHLYILGSQSTPHVFFFPPLLFIFNVSPFTLLFILCFQRCQKLGHLPSLRTLSLLYNSHEAWGLFDNFEWSWPSNKSLVEKKNY